MRADFVVVLFSRYKFRTSHATELPPRTPPRGATHMGKAKRGAGGGRKAPAHEASSLLDQHGGNGGGDFDACSTLNGKSEEDHDQLPKVVAESDVVTEDDGSKALVGGHGDLIPRGGGGDFVKGLLGASGACLGSVRLAKTR